MPTAPVQPGQQRLRPFKPQRFGRYTLLQPLATGGMGEIFLAHLGGAEGFEKLCVIKKILPHLAAEPDFVGRFVDEAKILVKLAHGSIAHVLDMGVEDGAPFIALEFVDGKDLRRVQARAAERHEPLPLAFILHVATRMLDALGYAHRKRGDDDAELDLVHRDISPQNVLISYEGEVKLIDFGLAKSTLSAGRTHPSILLGKFMYMSPEQARHQKVDRRSDLYAVGLTLYELIAGKNPFEALPPGEVLNRVINPAIPPLPQVAPTTPPALAELITRALAPAPEQRFQTAEEFRNKLTAVLLELDPTAGAETASQTMRALFAEEYQGERKMLAALKEQARALPEEASPGEADGPRTPVPAARPLTGARPTPPASGSVKPEVEPLSFAPSRKSGTHERLVREEPRTDPAIEPRPARGSKASLPKVKDVPSTEAAMPAPDATPPKPRPSSRPAPKRPEEPPAASRTPTAELPAAAAPPPKKSGGMGAWVALPIVVVLGVGAYIGWDQYLDAQNKKAQEAEQARRTEEPVEEPRRSREVKVPGKEEPKVERRATEEELAALPAKEKEAPKKPKAAAPAPPSPKSAATPGEVAFKQLRADFDKLINESAQKKYRIRVTLLGDKLRERGNDPAFVKEVTSLNQSIRDELAKPENQ